MRATLEHAPVALLQILCTRRQPLFGNRDACVEDSLEAEKARREGEGCTTVVGEVAGRDLAQLARASVACER